MPREGWLERQLQNTAKSVYEWPEWMRREAGIPDPEKNAINDLRAELARVRAAIEYLFTPGPGIAVPEPYPENECHEPHKKTWNDKLAKLRAALEGRG